MRISNSNKIILSILLTLIVTVAISFTAMPAYAAEAEGIDISTADDLRAMENNPSGKYYLTRDIEVPENMALFTDYNKPFTGTLDGKGHKLKNYKISLNSYGSAGLFRWEKNATFKNISMTGIDVKITGTGGEIGILSHKAKKCSFSKIKLSGKVTANLSGDEEGFLRVSGITYIGNGTGSISDCQTSVNMTVKSGLPQNEIHASGVALYYDSGTIKKCTNSGDITVSGKLGTDYSMNAFGIAGYYEGSQVVRRRNIFNNYNTGSGKAYGSSPVSWKDWVAKATKVSSITKSKCSKLSSTYWTYSSKYKRMILKNNK